MSSIREETLDENSVCSNRSIVACGTICIIVATLSFFGNISMIVWLFEYSYPIKFSVICFMVASGILYLTSFTSSLLLITKGYPNKKRTKVNSNEESAAVFHQREGTQDSYEMTTNISYREDPNLLQLPQKVVVRKTPPPPYENSATRDHSNSANEMEEARTTLHTFDDDGLNRRYYDLEENRVYRNGVIRVTECLMNDSEVEAQTSPKLIASFDKSPSSSNEIRQQRVANSQFLLQAQGQSTVNGSRSSFRDEQHLQTPTIPERSPRPDLRVKRIPSTTLKRKLNTRMSMSQSDLDSETEKRSFSSNSNTGMHSNSNLDGSSQVSQSDWNARVRTSHSSLTPEMTPRFLRRSAEVRTSHLYFKPPAVLPRTSQSSLNSENSFPSSNTEGKKPESSSNLNTRRQQPPSKSNWLLPTDRRFKSHSDLNMNADHQPRTSQSNSNSETPESESRMYSESDISLGNSCSNVSDVVTQSHVNNLKKVYQPEQSVSRSKDGPSLHKARSFGSLTVNASNNHQLGTEEIQTVEGNASDGNHHSYVTGRSTDSVLDASKNAKLLTPQEWMSAWDHRFHKQRHVNEGRIMGVRL